MGPVPVLRSCLVQLIHQQTPGTVCHFVCSAEDYSQLSKIILNFKLFKKSSPRTYQGTRGGQEHETKDSKHHVLVRKNKILPLLNHFSAAFQIYIKLTSLSKKSGIKNWTQVQPFGSWTKCFQSWNSNILAGISPQWKFDSPSSAEIFYEFAHQRIPLCLSLQNL